MLYKESGENFRAYLEEVRIIKSYLEVLLNDKQYREVEEY